MDAVKESPGMSEDMLDMLICQADIAVEPSPPFML